MGSILPRPLYELPLVGLTDQGYISKVNIFSETSKCTADIFLEIVPLETKLFRHV